MANWFIMRLWSSGYDRGFPRTFAGMAKIRKQPLTRVQIPAAAFDIFYFSYKTNLMMTFYISY